MNKTLNAIMVLMRVERNNGHLVQATDTVVIGQGQKFKKGLFKKFGNRQ